MPRWSWKLRGVETLSPEEERSTARISYKVEMSQGTSFILDFTVHPEDDKRDIKKEKQELEETQVLYLGHTTKLFCPL